MGASRSGEIRSRGEFAIELEACELSERKSFPIVAAAKGDLGFGKCDKRRGTLLASKLKPIIEGDYSTGVKYFWQRLLQCL